MPDSCMQRTHEGARWKPWACFLQIKKKKMVVALSVFHSTTAASHVMGNKLPKSTQGKNKQITFPASKTVCAWYPHPCGTCINISIRDDLSEIVRLSATH